MQNEKICKFFSNSCIGVSVTASAFALEDPVQNEIYNKPVTQIIHPKYVESLLKEKKWKKLGGV